MEFQFDQITGNEVRNTRQGLEIIRPCYVKDIEIAEGTSDPEVLLKIISDPQCPKIDDAHPSTLVDAVLDEHRLRSIDSSFKTSAWMDLVYRATPITLVPGAPIQFVVEQSSQQVTVTTYGTAGGTALTIWYKKGEEATTAVFPTGGVLKGVGVTKILTYDVLRAVGTATRAQWDAIKGVVRAARGKIHSDNWGTAERGKYFFLGPTTRYLSGSKFVNIQLEFLGDENGHFPLVAYFDEHGEHPADSASENDVRSGGPPGENTYSGRNGMLLASIYGETPFGGLFNFTPDD